MSEKPSPPHLSVASSFTAADYPYSFPNKLNCADNQFEDLKSLAEMRKAAHIARIADYKLFEKHDGNIIYFRTIQDLAKFKIAIKPGNDTTAEFVSAEPDYDVQELKRIRNELQNKTDKAGFADMLHFKLDQETRTIYYRASSMNMFFAFADFVEANWDAFQPYLSLQRKEPEFDIPFPSKEEAVQPKISYGDDDETDICKETEPSPKSMGITLGGKAEGAEKSKDRSHLSLVKSFEPGMHGYDFQLTPSIIYDPKRSKGDALFQNHPDYPAFKQAIKTTWVMERIRFAMEQAEVEDYYLTNGRNGLEAWFKTDKDWEVSHASFMPDTGYNVDYLHCSPYSSPMKIRKKAKRMQEIFAEIGVNVNVKFVADEERRVIQAVMPSFNDFMQVHGIFRKLQKTHKKFQALIGSKMNLTL